MYVCVCQTVCCEIYSKACHFSCEQWLFSRLYDANAVTVAHDCHQSLSFTLPICHGRQRRRLGWMVSWMNVSFSPKVLHAHPQEVNHDASGEATPTITGFDRDELRKRENTYAMC